MENQIKIKRTTDELISYLIRSKRELKQEIKNDVKTKEFQDALEYLRNKSKKIA